ncbi:MAG TPA: hypothetical protein PLC98_12095 [Anaerolineales bacterium]|nr:hypothetical protein [Anaerolineales bacterium]
MPDLAQIDWMMVGIALVVLAVVWGIIQRTLKLTLQLFTCGCAVLAGLVLGVAALIYIAPQFQ